MATEGTESEHTLAGGAPGSGLGLGPGPGLGPGAGLHARSFKLRFASQREPGRSYVSLVRPLGLPATVTGKFYAREPAGGPDDQHMRCALHRIEDMFRRGPRDRSPAPLTSSQVVGWYAWGAAPPLADRRLEHHICDSAWLKERMRVLAADDRLKQR